ncbi:hypothetical protein JCM10908_001509 [Rhodotorula pacifica]|uniref:uncharacterized protein n=1 Tax=Rhodotorula pacifica TaxID=1495444 RepID=UPI00316E132B
MPSHPRSPRPRLLPALAPLLLPTSPSTSRPDAPRSAPPAAAPQPPTGERTPLLRSMASFGPDDLRRKSQRVSQLLFHHDERSSADDSSPLLPPPTTPVRASASHDDGAYSDNDDWLSPARSRTGARRTRSRARSSILGAAGGSLKSRRTPRRGYDAEFAAELEGEGGNGVRSWYDNFTTVDWLHDAVKHSIRLRRVRRLKRTLGLRGQLINLWDGAQGWVLVTLIGFFTACIAFAIIRSEMWLFDLKEGYCERDWRRARRFCCTTTTTTGTPLTGEASGCASWRTWGQVWHDRSGIDRALGAYAVYAVAALTLATLASTLTIYFTASTSVYSSKDSPSLPHAGRFANDVQKSFYGATDTNGVSSPASPDSDSSTTPTLKPRARKTLYYAAGSGIPEIKTILSGFVIRGYLGSWTLGVKAVGLALSVASGLSLGKEGPFVHIASCVGNILSRFFRKYDRNEGKRREILSAACAAGVAVSFGAPVGGVLFSLEEVSYYFPPRTMLRSFWCAMIAAMTLKILNPFGSGKIVLFAVTYDRDWHSFELLGFVALAVFGGVYGACFCKANVAWTKHVRNGALLKKHPILEVALVTLLTTAVSFYNPWSKMGGTELISELFSECYKDDRLSGLCITQPSQVFPLVGSLLLALALKAALTTITFGIKLPAGIFIPTLAVGALAGRSAGLVVEWLHAQYPSSFMFEACRVAGGEDGPLPFGQACVIPGVWSIVGAAAALAGVTRTTVSLAVICFELTGTLTWSLPTMLAVLLAKTVADAIEPRSIYDLVIEVADLPYLDAKAEYLHDASPTDILDAEAPRISLDEENTLASLHAKLTELYASGAAGGFPICGAIYSEDEGHSGDRAYAYIASKELEHGLGLAMAQGLPGDTPCSFRTAQAARKGGGGAAGGAGTSSSVPVSGFATPEVSAGESFDLSWLTDQAPLAIRARSPMELLHEMFVKLGVRYVVVVDDRGLYLGLVEKNRYLVYLRWLEKRATASGFSGLPSMTGSRWRQEAEAEAETAIVERSGLHSRGRSEVRQVA